jgi:signal peptidase I
MHNGDMAIVERQSAYHVGDIIAYRIPAGETGAGQDVIHRIVGGNGVTGFVTKGDHNSYTDHFWHPTTSDVVGKVWFHIPGVARILGHLRSPGVLAATVGIVTFVIMAWPRKRDEGEESTVDGV